MRFSDIPTKRKWWMLLGFPITTGIAAYLFRAMIEVGWPPLSAGIGLTIGFFIASSLMGIFKPELAVQEKEQNPTRFQRIGRIVLYTLLTSAFVFVTIRFLILV
ncbi:hypothetical protein DH09_12050 [Bacillaceae bacterium JMAK1]|nr:hypothetical protein DH09_12050 [Bacillaceae bacterium JMAK1]